MKFLIVANGPFLTKYIIQEAARGKHIVALDGACDKLARIGMMPHVVLGDLDSINESRNTFWGINATFNGINEDSPEYMGKYGVKIVPAKNQDLTDLVKGIKYCDKHGAESIDIVCATGGRMDHTLSNLRALRSEYRDQRPIYLHTESQTMIFVRSKKVFIQGRVGEYCGIFAFPSAKFSSTGLKYNGDNYELIYGIAESSSNQLEKEIADIDVEGDAIIVNPGQLKAQRDFMSLRLDQQLQQLLAEQQYVLQEVSAEELRHVRNIRRSIKALLDIKKYNKSSFMISTQPEKEPSIYYLSHSKEQAYDQDKLDCKEKILVSMSQQKFHAFTLFIQTKANNIQQSNIKEIVKIASEIYPKEIMRQPLLSKL